MSKINLQQAAYNNENLAFEEQEIKFFILKFPEHNCKISYLIRAFTILIFVNVKQVKRVIK